jgi:hypothetical protein
MATQPLRGALALVLVACAGRSELPVPDCNAPAVDYCQANGCPFTGPASSSETDVGAWCSSAPVFAARVTGAGTCTTPGGQTWAIDVRASDGTGAQLYVLYDPSSAQLLSVSTVGAGVGDGGEVDYGTCDNSGIVTCTTTPVSCAR